MIITGPGDHFKLHPARPRIASLSPSKNYTIIKWITVRLGFTLGDAPVQLGGGEEYIFEEKIANNFTTLKS